MTTIPDDDLRPRPGGLIKDQDKPQDLEDLARDETVRPTPAREDERVSREER
ncbi:MAG TPA: hypothetical protein VNT60_07810 [Deinococcales bacterium]|nr:hypothetical protein [Deinococcales bacterium]